MVERLNGRGFTPRKRVCRLGSGPGQQHLGLVQNLDQGSSAYPSSRLRSWSARVVCHYRRVVEYKGCEYGWVSTWAALIVSIRRTILNMHFATSLCHAYIVRATDEEGPIYMAAFEARTIINKTYIDENIQDWWTHSWIIDAVDKIGERTLGISAVKSNFDSIMGQNPQSPIAEWWRAASPEMQQDFELRRTTGDICWFREYHVSQSMKTASPAVASPDGQRWFVD